MSSRNTYMNAEERQAALVLSRSIRLGKQMIADGERNVKTITDAMRAEIEKEPMARIDYVEIVNNLTMESIDTVKGDILCAIAVYIDEKVRLIDNFMEDDVE